MGEAKRKKAKLERAPCVCGSQKPARECCFNGRSWHKPPATLGLKVLPQASVVDKCYMKELHSCDGGISGEHLITESIIRLLKADGEFTVSGLPWIPEGEVKTLAPKNLTANCLCSKHNSALSPLDAAALYFFSALKSCLDRDAQSMRYIVSGHDIERWLLKTVKAMAASGNLARGRERLSGAFSSDVSVLDMLDDPQRWPESTGLYGVMNDGEMTQNHNRFQLAPFTNPQGELGGLGVNIMGLSFLLMLEPLDILVNPQLQKAVFRPGQIMITYPKSTNWIAISWDDGKQHTNTLSLKFLREVQTNAAF